MYRLLLLIPLFFYSKNTHSQPIGVKTSPVDTCKVPTVITPNGDGENDIWEIPCLPADDKLNKSELYIFSEWGEQLAYHRPYKNTWDGTYKGAPLPDGTYFYIFKFAPDAPAQRGYLTLFR
jgi:gliding motility-associated-like protein